MLVICYSSMQIKLIQTKGKNVYVERDLRYLEHEESGHEAEVS